MKKRLPKKVVAKVSNLHTNDDVRRYVGAVSEEFQGYVSAVAEQYMSIHEKLDSVVETVGGIKEDVEIIKSNIEILKSGIRIKVDYQDFEALERRVRLMETKMRR
jgi:hypothetical protein